MFQVTKRASKKFSPSCMFVAQQTSGAVRKKLLEMYHKDMGFLHLIFVVAILLPELGGRIVALSLWIGGLCPAV